MEGVRNTTVVQQSASSLSCVSLLYNLLYNIIYHKRKKWSLRYNNILHDKLIIRRA